MLGIGHSNLDDSNERKLRGLGEFWLTIFYVSSYIHKRRPYSATFHSASFNLNSFLALRIRPQTSSTIGGGGGVVTYLSPLRRERREKASTGDIFYQPLSNVMNSGQACRPCRGSCSLIPGRSCFGVLPGDEIVVSPPSPIVQPLPSERLAVGVAPRALWLAGIFLRRKEVMCRCSRDPHRLGVEMGGRHNDDTTAAVRCTV